MNAIRAKGLTKRYGETLALDSLDLAIEPGEVYGYLGPNGAGKTTTIRLLLGLHRPSAGRAELFGVDAWADPVNAHRRVAYVAGEPFLWPSLTSAETFAFLARLHGGTDVAYRDELVERFKLDADKKVRALSKGNRQKVQLIAALASRAELLILDEPTSRPGPADGGRLPRERHRGQARAARRSSSPPTSSARSRRSATGSGSSADGRLVDEGTLEQLRHLSAHTVEVELRGAGAGAAAAGGRAGRALGRERAALRGHGPVRPLLAALAGLPVATLTSREPSLEEIFLHHYDRADGGRRARAAAR